MFFSRKHDTAAVPRQREYAPYKNNFLWLMEMAESGKREDVARHVAASIKRVLDAKEQGTRADYDRAYVGFLDTRHDVMKTQGLNLDKFNELVDYSLQLIQQESELVATETSAHE